jgi:hypothetical protein
MVTIHPPLISFLTPGRAEELTGAGLFADDLPGMRSAYLETLRHLIFFIDVWSAR